MSHEEVLKMKQQLFSLEGRVKPPFLVCPMCKNNTFGVERIIGSVEKGYQRTCKSCAYENFYQLPKIEKKIIYLDQFAISNMMKSINPTNPSYGKGELNIWKRIFIKIDTLCKKQIIICPYSDIHEDESACTNTTVYQAYNDLKKMYNHLGGGDGFLQSDVLRNKQILDHFECRISKKEYKPNLDKKDAFGKNSILSEWQGHIYVSIYHEINQYDLDIIIRLRDSLSNDMKAIFEKVRSKENKTFIQRYEEEFRSFGPTYYKEWVLSALNFVQQEKKQNYEQLANIISSPMQNLISNITSLLKQYKIEEEESVDYIKEYFNSVDFSKIPYINISSALWADLAIQTNNGRKAPPNRGESNDVKAISTYGPYCDAMLIDSKMYSRLTQNPLKDKLSENNYLPRFFSNKEKELITFLNYLDEIENNITIEHKQAVSELYGEISPYTSMYKK